MEFDGIMDHAGEQRRYEQHVCSPFPATHLHLAFVMSYQHRILLDSRCIGVQKDPKQVQSILWKLLCYRRKRNDGATHS